MDPERAKASKLSPVPSEWLCRWLAGSQAGFLGSLAALLWYCLHSAMSGELWWTKLNVAAGLFYGHQVYSMGFGRATLAGASLLIVLYGLAGALFGLAAPARAAFSNVLAAAAYSTVLALAANRWLWSALDSFAPSFFPPLAVFIAHLLYALVLSLFPRFLSSLQQQEIQPPARSLETPGGEQAVAPPHIVESETDRLE